MLEVVKPCLPGYNYHVEETPQGLTVLFNQSEQREYGLGNHLAQYFQARGVALLGGMHFETIPPFEFQNIRLPKFVPRPMENRFQRVLELKHYCDTCPSEPLFWRWYHTCPAAWLAVDIPTELRRSIAILAPRYPRRRVVIQFRCGDSHRHPDYGMLPFSFYHKALAGHVTKATKVSILPDPGVPHAQMCRRLLKALTVALNHTFGCPVEILQPSSLVQDYGTMLSARVFVSSVSSLGMWAALAGRGQAYVPVHKIMIGGKKPCLDRFNITWIDTDSYSVIYPDVAASAPKWFPDDDSMREAITQAFQIS
eukprot:EG_transcript_13895